MNKKYLAFAALAALTLAGCSNDEELSPQTDELKDTPINISVSVAELQTRAGYEGTTTVPEQFYLSIDQKGDK